MIYSPQMGFGTQQGPPQANMTHQQMMMPNMVFPGSNMTMNSGMPEMVMMSMGFPMGGMPGMVMPHQYPL